MNKKYKSAYDLNDKGIISIIDDLPLWSAPFGLKLLDTIKYKRNIKVLDIGSGNGFPVVEVASRLGSTSEITALDPWVEAGNRIEKKIKGWDIPNLSFKEGVAEDLPFDDTYFDLVMSNNGINNVQDEEKVWSEISRVMKPKAQFVFTVNLPESMIEFYDVFTKVLENNSMFDEANEVEDHIYDKRKPIDHFLKLLDENGFKLNKIVEDVFNFTYADGTSMLNHFFIKLAFKDGWVNVLPEENVSEIFNEVERELNDFASIKGSLKVTIPFICIDAEKK